MRSWSLADISAGGNTSGAGSAHRRGLGGIVSGAGSGSTSGAGVGILSGGGKITTSGAGEGTVSGGGEGHDIWRGRRNSVRCEHGISEHFQAALPRCSIPAATRSVPNGSSLGGAPAPSAAAVKPKRPSERWPRATMRSLSSGEYLKRQGLSGRRIHPYVNLLRRRQDDRHRLRMDRRDDGVKVHRLGRRRCRFSSRPLSPSALRSRVPRCRKNASGLSSPRQPDGRVRAIRQGLYLR